MKRNRLRVFDLNTPWFWIVWFWYGSRGHDARMEITVYRGQSWQRFWFNCWKREEYQGLEDFGEYAVSEAGEIGGSALCRSK